MRLRRPSRLAVAAGPVAAGGQLGRRQAACVDHGPGRLSATLTIGGHAPMSAHSADVHRSPSADLRGVVEHVVAGAALRDAGHPHRDVGGRRRADRHLLDREAVVAQLGDAGERRSLLVRDLVDGALRRREVAVARVGEDAAQAQPTDLRDARRRLERALGRHADAPVAHVDLQQHVEGAARLAECPRQGARALDGVDAAGHARAVGQPQQPPALVLADGGEGDEQVVEAGGDEDLGLARRPSRRRAPRRRRRAEAARSPGTCGSSRAAAAAPRPGAHAPPCG